MKISVVGLGKLGAPLSAVLASKGHKVVGIDVNEQYVNRINSGRAPVDEPQLQELISLHRDNLRASLNFDDVLNTDATFVIVPTPSQEDGLFSNQFLLSAVEEIGKVLRRKNAYHLVVITSTVTPGSTQGVIRDALEMSSGKKINADFGVCYNPEFIALGTVIRDMLFPDMILIGESDEKAGLFLQSIYLSICEKNPPIRRMSLINAEVTKIAINTYVTSKISYANMLSDICERLPNADVNVVTDAIGLDSRIGSKYLKAAVAFGGPCFPRDNTALVALAHQLGSRADIAEATHAINQYQNERLMTLLSQCARSSRIAILGLAYKAGTYVVEESQGIKITNYLAENGYQVFVYDPMAMNEAKKVLTSDHIKYANSLQDCVESSDTVVILVPWEEFKLLKAEWCIGKVVVDYWRILPKQAFDEVCELVYPGLNKEGCCAKR